MWRLLPGRPYLYSRGCATSGGHGYRFQPTTLGFQLTARQANNSKAMAGAFIPGSDGIHATGFARRPHSKRILPDRRVRFDAVAIHRAHSKGHTKAECAIRRASSSIGRARDRRGRRGVYVAQMPPMAITTPRAIISTCSVTPLSVTRRPRPPQFTPPVDTPQYADYCRKLRSQHRRRRVGHDIKEEMRYLANQQPPCALMEISSTANSQPTRHDV